MSSYCVKLLTRKTNEVEQTVRPVIDEATLPNCFDSTVELGGLFVSLKAWPPLAALPFAVVVLSRCHISTRHGGIETWET